MEVLYHLRPYFEGIFPYIGLIQALYMVGTQFRFLKWPLNFAGIHGDLMGLNGTSTSVTSWTMPQLNGML
jgi:hypothetical protein